MSRPQDVLPLRVARSRCCDGGFNKTTVDLILTQRCFRLLKELQYGTLTDFQCPVIFSSEFSVLPQKISENLRTDSLSGANTRIVRTLHKLLNSNNLCLMFIFSCCNKHHFSMRYCPFQGLKRTISHPQTDGITG